MSKIKEILNRIHTIAGIQQLTQAMKMIASSKLAKAHREKKKKLVYAQHFIEVFEGVAFNPRPPCSAYFIQQPLEKALIIVFSTSRGFCGALNKHVLQPAMDRYQAYASQDKQAEMLPIGQKGLAFVQKKQLPHIASYVKLGHTPSLEGASLLTKFVMQAFEANTYQRVEMVYQTSGQPTPKTVAIQQLLPLLPTGEQQKTPVEYIFEPNQEAITRHMLPQVVALRVYQVLLKAMVAEQTARMVAMSKAAENAETLIKDLRLMYNRMRQATATRQILEVAAGAEAINDE